MQQQSSHLRQCGIVAEPWHDLAYAGIGALGDHQERGGTKMDGGGEWRGLPNAAVTVERVAHPDRGKQNRQRRGRHHMVNREPHADRVAEGAPPGGDVW